MIRSALPTDAKAIARVHVSVWQSAYRALMPAEFLASLEATLAQREAFWASLIAAEESQVIVAEIDGHVVGWISVGLSRDDDAVGTFTGEVMAIYVLATHWQTGVGRALWHAGLQRLSEQGHTRSTLWVLAENVRAIRFYRASGWIEESVTNHLIKIGDTELEEVRFRSP